MLAQPYPFMFPAVPPQGVPRYPQIPVPPIVPHPQPMSNDVLPTDKDQLGERLYPLVERLEPEHAGKITGMFLEMQVDQLHSMIMDEEQLKQWVAEARKELSAVSN